MVRQSSWSPSDDAEPSAEERDWIRRVGQDDPAAFEAIFTRYAHRLGRFVHGILGSREDSEEIVHDVFLWIWQHRAEWQVPGSLKTYLFRAAYHRSVSLLRRRRVARRFSERRTQEPGVSATMPSGAPAPDELSVANEIAGRVAQLVSEMPGRARQVFLLNRQHNLSHQQIAEILELSVKTVEIHMGRALAVLRRGLIEEDRTEPPG